MELEHEVFMLKLQEFYMAVLSFSLVDENGVSYKGRDQAEETLKETFRFFQEKVDFIKKDEKLKKIWDAIEELVCKMH